MTDEELAALWERAQEQRMLNVHADGTATVNTAVMERFVGDHGRLLNEVKRLRAENAALREIAEKVAEAEACECRLDGGLDVGLFMAEVNVLYVRDQARALLSAAQEK